MQTGSKHRRVSKLALYHQVVSVGKGVCNKFSVMNTTCFNFFNLKFKMYFAFDNSEVQGPFGRRI